MLAISLDSTNCKSQLILWLSGTTEKPGKNHHQNLWGLSPTYPQKGTKRQDISHKTSTLQLMKLEKASLLHTKPNCKVPRPTPKLQNQNLNKLQPVCSAMELWFIYSGTPYSLPMHWSSCTRDSTNKTNRKIYQRRPKTKGRHGQLSLQLMKSYLKTKRLPKKGGEKKEMGRGRRWEAA
jgi:hypothetical protein